MLILTDKGMTSVVKEIFLKLTKQVLHSRFNKILNSCDYILPLISLKKNDKEN
jgi:hypothetical protein